ncbi:MAG: hypothetical protein GY798_26070 [Hyphomicrobiales bacterium]|nr:hypothetical protein [Hyphomicrobiales bacterium]
MAAGAMRRQNRFVVGTGEFQMLKIMVMVSGLVLAMTAPGFAADWVVIKAVDGCYVTRHKKAGENQVGGAHASRSEATKAMRSIPACETANIDVDPDTDSDIPNN